MNRKTVSCLAAALALGAMQWAQAQCPVTAPDSNLASPFQAGPVNPNNGFAEFVTDSGGRSLELCLAGDGVTGACFFDPVVAGNLFSEQIGFGAEAFWWLAEASIVTAAGLDARVVMAAEAAFLTENPVNGEQFPFTRLRIRIDVPQPGVYTVTHPYGTETFTVQAVDAGQEIRTSYDVEFVPAPPGAAGAQNQGCVGPWLAWDGTPAPPDGFIGDGATPHAVTGSPTDKNFFEISAVDLSGNTIDLTGPDAAGTTARTDLFTVWGKLYDGRLATPMVVDRSSYERFAGAAGQPPTGQVDVFATAAQTATVNFNGAPNLPAGDIPLLSDGADPRVVGKFFASVGLIPDAALIPPVVEINATDTSTDRTRLLRLVSDRVTISTARYNLFDKVLTVKATTSDALLTGPLTLAEYGLPLPARVTTDAPPARVNVFSAVGGTTGAQVEVVDNAPPVAVPDTFTVAEDSGATPLTVLGNDTPVDGIDETSLLIVTAPTKGTAVANPDGTVTYTPNANFYGTDTFTYTVEDDTDLLSNAATVTVTVTPTPDAPVAVADSADTAQGSAVTIAVLANDSDPDNLPPAAPNAGLSVSTVTQGTTGQVTNNGTNVTYTPNAGFAGTDTFSYTATDGDLTSTATVTVRVNRNPVAGPDSSSVNEDSGSTILNVLSNDTDPDGDSLTIAAVTQPAAGTGTVANNGASLSYTPALNFNGTATFTYTVSDGHGGTATATVTVTVNPVNDNPLAVADSATTTSGTAVTINVLNNDIDVDNVAPAAPNAGLTITAVTTPTNGLVEVNNSTSVTYTSGAGFTGTATFTYTISDGNGGTGTATVVVTVNAASAPVDLDISALRVTGQVRVGGTVTVRLDVRNGGTVNGQRPATVVGVQGTTQVYSQTVQVSDAPGGGSTSFNFSSHTVEAAGNTAWTATIADDNGDLDRVTATTRVR